MTPRRPTLISSAPPPAAGSAPTPTRSAPVTGRYSERPNGYELAARARKVEAFVAVLDQLAVAAGATPAQEPAAILELLSRLTDLDWARLARAIGQRVPSGTTREEIRREYEQRRDLARRLLAEIAGGAR